MTISRASMPSNQVLTYSDVNTFKCLRQYVRYGHLETITAVRLTGHRQSHDDNVMANHVGGGANNMHI